MQLIVRRFFVDSFAEPVSESLPVFAFQGALEVPVWNLRRRSRMIATHYFNLIRARGVAVFFVYG